MAKPVELPNGRSWPTQGAAKEHFKEMLHRYADEAVVTDLQDHEDLVALLQRYDEAPDTVAPKIGCGVEALFRRRNVGQGYSTPGFWVRRTDGSETDFSYIQAVRQEHASQAREFYDACRYAVEADLLAAKKAHFALHGDATRSVPCEVSGAPVRFEDAHLDHAYPTFGQLVVAYRAAKGWGREIPAGLVTPPADGQTRARFVSDAERDLFRDYHHAAASLRIVQRRANLALAAGQRRPVIRRPVVVVAA